MEFLENVYLGNEVRDYFIAVGYFFVGVVVLVLAEKLILSRIKALTEKTEWDLDDIVLGIIEKTLLPLLYLASFNFSVRQLVVEAHVTKVILTLTIIVFVVQMTRLILAILILFLERAWLGREGSTVGASASKSILTIIKIGVWGIATVFILDNLGFNVSAVVAGLGIGGIAVAFAAQTILGDLFNYFVIFFDKPFREGDFVILDDYLGTIEHVGIKTTRIRSLGGEQIVCSNTDLTSSRIRNYKRMEKRRVLFKLGVTYQTPHEKMQKVPATIKGIVESVDGTIFDRAHFQAYGDFSLNIEIVYYVLSADYNRYMDIQQTINLAIMEAFEKEGIEFAYPTQTLYVEK